MYALPPNPPPIVHNIVQCPRCKHSKQTSRVYKNGCRITESNCDEGFYDEHGRWTLPPACGNVVCSYRCSKGHLFNSRELELGDR
jgi:hypothetical protein